MAKKIRVSPMELITMLDDGMTQKEIADFFGCDPSTISREIQKYKKLGYPIEPRRTGRKLGSRNVPKKPFLQEVYEMIEQIGGFED